MNPRSIIEAGNLKDKKVLVRVNWNVPMNNGKVEDDFRIRKSMPTLEYLKKQGAKLIIISHLTQESASLRPVCDYVNNFFPLTFETESDAVLLENLRYNPGEKKNDPAFAKFLSSKANIYVNEAFPDSHRQHASIVGVPKLLPSFLGLQFFLETQALSKAFYPKKPFLLILGGAKFDTKLPILEKFVHIADDIFVGGALANNFLKEQGVDVGNSLVSKKDFKFKELLNTGKIILPEDTIVKDGKILDAGPKTVENLKPVIIASKLVLWNGPLGSYEMGYKVATLALAEMISEFAHESIVGGGDTLAAIRELNLFNKFSFISTGGGAMLDFLATGTLPGIEAIKESPRGSSRH